MAKNLLNDGSVKLKGNINFNGYSIYNIKELVPQASGAGSIGKWGFRWNILGQIINVPHLNIQGVSGISTGSTSISDDVAITYGVGVPPSNTDIATQLAQSRIFFDNSGNISFLFSNTDIGSRIQNWTTTTTINEDGISSTTIAASKIQTCEIECSDSSGLQISSDITTNNINAAAILANSISVGSFSVGTFNITNLNVSNNATIDGILTFGAETGTSRTVTADYIITDIDRTIFTASGVAITVTLPNAVGRQGRRYTIRETLDAAAPPGPVTIDSNGGNVDGGANYALVAGAYVTFESDGTDWYIVA